MSNYDNEYIFQDITDYINNLISIEDIISHDEPYNSYNLGKEGRNMTLIDYDVEYFRDWFYKECIYSKKINISIFKFLYLIVVNLKEVIILMICFFELHLSFHLERLCRYLMIQNLII